MGEISNPVVSKSKFADKKERKQKISNIPTTLNVFDMRSSRFGEKLKHLKCKQLHKLYDCY